MDLTDRRLERQYRRYAWLSRLGIVVVSIPWLFDADTVLKAVAAVVVVLALVEGVFWCLAHKSVGSG